jgi:hypothetical protein
MYNVAATAPGIHIHHGNMQNANTPDIDLDRDVLDPNAEVLLGIEASELATMKKKLPQNSKLTYLLF